MTDLLIDKVGPVTIFTLNRPERHNALSPSLSADGKAAVAEFQEDPAQRVLIITGSGDKAFCSGADLKVMRSGQAADDSNRKRPLPMANAPDMLDLALCEKPVIAAVNGLAVGAGLEIAICCDIRLATENAWFALPEAERGFIAGVAAITLPRLLPFGVVADMMLSGERLTAQDGLRFGFVQGVTSQDKLLEEAMRRADRMAKFSQPALWGTKRTIRYWRDLMLQEHYNYYSAIVHRVLLSGDMLEGIKAFTEKREAQYTAGWPDPFKE